MENRTYAKPMYKCALCDSIYDTVAQRVECEQLCLKRKEEEDKKAAATKRNAERESDFSEASAALDNALALVNKCVEKHGVFQYRGKMKELDFLNMDFFPSKLWHHFWF